MPCARNAPMRGICSGHVRRRNTFGAIHRPKDFVNFLYSSERESKTLHSPRARAHSYQFAGGGITGCRVKTCCHGLGLLGLRSPPAHREQNHRIWSSPPRVCPISGQLLPSQHYSGHTQAGGNTPKHNQAIRPGTIRNPNISSPDDVKRKKDQPGCRWRKRFVGGGGSCVSGRRSDNVRSTSPTVGLISSVRLVKGSECKGRRAERMRDRWCEWGRGGRWG